MRTKSYRARVDHLIETARNHVGYRARAQKVSQYGAAQGSDGQAWAGAFLETILREAGELSQPNLTHTVSALAEYTRTNRLYTKPQPGDIVFLTASTDHPFAQPHIGLVVDTEKWKTEGTFRTVEGQVSSGLAKGPQESDGVYERTRYSTDVLAFARPIYRDRKDVQPDDGVPTVRVANVQPGKAGRSTTAVQSALGVAVGARGLERGKFDRGTVAATAAYQRKIGYGADRATGQPDETTLRRLALDTEFRFFRVS